MTENILTVLRFIMETALYCGVTFSIFWLFWRTTDFLGKIDKAIKDIEYLKTKSTKARIDIEKLKHSTEKSSR